MILSCKNIFRQCYFRKKSHKLAPPRAAPEKKVGGRGLPGPPVPPPMLATLADHLFCAYLQRWSRGHKARGQGLGHKKNPRPRPRTALPRTDTLEAKDRNARGQGQGPRTQAQVLSKKKKKVFTKIFQAISKKKKKVFTKIFQAISKKKKKKKVFTNFSSDLHKKTFSKKIFQALHKILTIQKILLSSSRGQANFRGLEASRPRPRT